MLRKSTSRRTFIATVASIVPAVWAYPVLAATGDAVTTGSGSTSGAASGPFKLPPLPYDYDALEPHIDKQTMTLHHDKHHDSYVNNLNSAIQKHSDLGDKKIEVLIRELKEIPEDIRTAVQNNGGGHINHTMFWEIMTPGGAKQPKGKLADEIQSTFGGFDDFKKQFNEAGAKRFGSGWVWLVRNNGKLEITSTANQDNPLMQGMQPIMGNDVWEHAYYLKYQNKRADYLQAWWNVVNWDKVAERFDAAS
jgi:superoxide dismutase, Fe-Mn family